MCKVNKLLRVLWESDNECTFVVNNKIMTKAQELGITKFPYKEYDDNGNLTYYEDPDGVWVKSEHDANGNLTYTENSKGYWFKWEYDANGNRTYFEYSDGGWFKCEFDENGNQKYFENSIGFIKDNRTK